MRLNLLCISDTKFIILILGIFLNPQQSECQELNMNTLDDAEIYVVNPASPDPGIIVEGNGGREGFVSEFMEDFVASHYTSATGFTYTQSFVHTMHLANLDKKIYLHLKSYADQLRERLSLIESYTKDFDRHSVNGFLDLTQMEYPDWAWASAISSNPLTAYQLIRRMSMGLPSVLKNIESGQETDLMDQIYTAKGNLQWLAKEDVEHAMEAILEIQNTYDLNVAQFSDGHISHANLTTEASLTSRQCYEIGSYAFGTNRFASAVEWMDAAWKKYFSQNDESISMDDLLADMNVAVLRHDEELAHHQQYGKTGQGFVYTDLFRDNVVALQKFDKEKLRHLHEAGTVVDPTLRFWNLCAGKYFQPKNPRSLYCKYEHDSHPYWRINPLKIEILNRNPRLVQVHDIIGETTRMELITHAFPVIEANTNAEVKAPIPAVLWEQDSEEFRKFSKTIEYLTRRRVSDDHYSAARLHVAVYSFGSSDSSNDKAEFSEMPKIKELEAVGLQHEKVTVHIFLNDVEAGGYTIFPNLGIAVKPKPRSAVFWYTFSEDVYHENLSVQSCPVVGHKWVATKYIREVGEDLQLQYFHNQFTKKKPTAVV